MNRSPISCIVLFDIDGTLVSGPLGGHGAGVFAMNAASIAVTGKPSRFIGADYAGRTDLQIARMLIEDAGTVPPTSENIEALIDAYVLHLSGRIDEHPCRPIGDPRAAVLALRAAGALVGLGTGNVRRGAQLKLRSAGLDDLFTPLEGGFGTDGITRTELLDAGVRDMAQKGPPLPAVIVGDTPRDIEGAKGIGALSVGIPFGRNTTDVLRGAGADSVIETIDESLVSVIRTLLENRR